jgi:hypothetical protein
LEPGSEQEAFLPEFLSPFSDVHCQGSIHSGANQEKEK